MDASTIVVPMKRVLVTGGAGFLGSHLCERLVADGCYVYCLDNISTGSTANIRTLRRHPRFVFLRQDVMAPISVAVDEIYNLACPASPVHYQADPVATTLTSVLGTLNVLRLAQRCGARVLQASTSEIYGDPAVHPQPEGYLGNVNPIGPRACYDEGKRCAESLCFDYHRQHGVPIKVARIFNTYGPRMLENDGRIVSNFVVQALRSEPLTVYGDGSQTRSFCYVNDLIDGLVRLMATPEDVTGPVNLGNPEEVSVADVARRVLARTDSPSPIVNLPLPRDDPARRRPDITEAARLFGWQPRTPLDDGLPHTIAYFQVRLSMQQTGRTNPAAGGGGKPVDRPRERAAAAS